MSMTEKLSTLDQFFALIDGPLSQLGQGTHLQDFTISPEEKLTEILNLFNQSDANDGKVECDSLVIVEDKKPIGIITEQDLLKKIPLDSEDRDALFSVSARDLMTAKLHTVTRNESVKSAMRLMSLRMFRHIPVVDEGGDYIFTLDLKSLFNLFLPIFSDHVHEELVISEWTHVTVDEYDSILPNEFTFNEISAHLELFFKVHLKRLVYHRPLILDYEATVKEAIELLSHRSRGSLLITRFETELVGILTERDLLHKFFTHTDLLMKADELKVIDFMTENPHMMLRKHTLGNALSNIQFYHYRNIILVDEDKLPLSIIELMDIFKFILFHLVDSHDKNS